MAEATQTNTDTNSKGNLQTGEKPKPTPIGRLPLAQVDASLAECEKTIKSHSDTVKTKLASNAAIPPNVLRELSKANAQKAKLMMRRISILIEAGDATALELIDKLMKLKLGKA